MCKGAEKETDESEIIYTHIYGILLGKLELKDYLRNTAGNHLPCRNKIS